MTFGIRFARKKVTSKKTFPVLYSLNGIAINWMATYGHWNLFYPFTNLGRIDDFENISSI